MSLLVDQKGTLFYPPYSLEHKMKYQLFGHTGVQVSQLALGTGNFGTGWGYGSSVEVICAELAGDFHLGYARQLTDKSSLLFDLAF